MIDSGALLKDLKVQLKLLVADLRGRAEDPSDAWGTRLREEYAEARKRERTGHSWPVWRDNEVDQAAVAWIVATTFLRFCEDNNLLIGAHLNGRPTPIGWIAGPGDRTALAEENLTAYFRVNPTHNRRHWLQQGFAVLAAQPAGKALIDRNHNPVWTALISPESAAALIEFWRRTDDSGSLVHDFTDADLGTRFLGDLYQDLSEHAKKTYALLQTPEFVEEFILDQTLTPALKEFGHDGLKLIDPTCGSGHFLLGAFHRLVKVWEDEAPALDVKEHVRRAMDSLHGVDLNPFAIAIARFRLTVAGINTTGERSLAAIPAFGYHLAIGDSLLGESGGVPATIPGIGGDDDPAAARTYLYDTEDLADYVGILQPGQYHVVIGNPPYITVKDKALNGLYRVLYRTSYRQYALSVPFMEFFYRLAVRGTLGGSAGYVGQITANSFMKREFGKKLIEDFFGGFLTDNPVDLLNVIDTSGAYIPGHGTPTVIIVGRRRAATGFVTVVMGIRGEPGRPADPVRGEVWSSIARNYDCPGYEGKYISVAELPQEVMAKHPWSLGGGGASDLKEAIESAAEQDLAERICRIGFVAMSHADEQFTRPLSHLQSGRVSGDVYRQLVSGENVRDFQVSVEEVSWFPYVSGEPMSTLAVARHLRGLWPYRTDLAGRSLFGGQTYGTAGKSWYSWHQIPKDHSAHEWVIAFAFVATHNHFSLDREVKVFKQSAPVIKLHAGATEDEHLELLGVLNSSVACFWLKQVCHNKGRPSADGAGADEPWEHRFEFAATKLEKFPLPGNLSSERGRILDTLATRFEERSPISTIALWLENPDCKLRPLLDATEDHWMALRRQMIFHQEELDWETYQSYGLLDRGVMHSGQVVEIDSSQRAFAIALGRGVVAGELDTTWFAHQNHNFTVNDDVPGEWAESYRDVVIDRLKIIKDSAAIRILEQAEFKRRWAADPWSAQLTEALNLAILDCLDQGELWRDEQGPRTRSVAELADVLRTDVVLRELAAVLTGSAEPDLPTVLGSLLVDEAVPYLAAHRYKPSGLEKYRIWQQVWDLQRREDAGEKVDIAVVPKYGKPDFRKDAYWKARGKLDVPKERFILYPDLRREADSTPVLGWAGWDHRDQALALGRELPVQESLGADGEALTPLVAGLVELELWLHQWHAEEDPVFGASPAAVITQVIDQYLSRMEKTRDDVTAWTPPAPTRGRRPKRS